MARDAWLEATESTMPGAGAPTITVEEEFASARVAALHAGFDFVDLEVFDVDPSAAATFPEHRARRDGAVPIGWKFGLVVIAVSAPDDLFVLDDIYLTVGRDVHIVVATPGQIASCTDFVYRERSGDRSKAPQPAANRVTSTPNPPAPTRDESDAASEHSERALDELVSPARSVFAGPNELLPGRSTVVDSWLSQPGSVGESSLAVDLQAATIDEATGDREAAGDLEASADLEPTGDFHAADDPDDPDAPGGLEAIDAEASSGGVGFGLDEVDDGLASETANGIGPGIADVDQVAEAPLLERVLVESGKVSEQRMSVALRQHESTGRPLREILAELGYVSDIDLQRAIATVEGLEFVDLNNWTIDPVAAHLLPESLARRYRILGIGFRGERPVIAMANPSDVFALDDVRTLVGREVDTVICTPTQIDDYLRRIYRHHEETDLAARNAALSAAASDASKIGDLDDLHAVVEDAPIVKFVNLVIRQALNERASDVHIEPTSTDLQVRFRIDGVLHHATSAPKTIQSGVTSRLKIMADLDIAEHRVPQDGRISLTANSREIDLRVATLPTVHGEKVVMRVLDRSTAPLDLARLGFLPEVLARYEESYRKPSGTILVTGPTGSGKSTTLYATLNKLNVPERNLITVEDPVEFQLRGVNQVQVNPKAGLTFANALRSILRSDPDVVLVGEIRDRETATIAIEAALTGHMVLTCLHTNDAASTPLRLVEMGVEPFLVCSALDCVLAQRLARELCDNCAEPYEPNAEELRAARWTEVNSAELDELNFRRPIGCQACSHTGFHGRLAIQEVMGVSEEIERAILVRGSTEEIKQIATAEGMRTLHQDGLHKAAMGLTSLEEILRVIV